MAQLRLSPVDGPAAWLGADLAADTTWLRPFSPSEIVALCRALEHLRRVNPELDLAKMTTHDFPIVDLADEIDDLRRAIIDGVGTRAYTGFPVADFNDTELRAIWWGLNLHVGTAVSQSWRGDVIGDVRDLGTGVTGRAGRGYTSNTELNFHSDASDLTGLFFLRQGKTGGVSRLASSVAVHNEIFRRRPDLLAVLYEPFTISCQNNELPGGRPWYDMPIFGRNGDDIACAYVRTNMLWAAKNTGSPPLTEAQIEAVEFVAEVAAEPQFGVERRFDAGTMWFCSNHTVLHMRTEFTDFDEPDRKRHLLRIWLSLPNGRALPESFATFFGDVSAGATRGGYAPRDGKLAFHTS
jgi:hypothetical protein